MALEVRRVRLVARSTDSAARVIWQMTSGKMSLALQLGHLFRSWNLLGLKGARTMLIQRHNPFPGNNIIHDYRLGVQLLLVNIVSVGLDTLRKGNQRTYRKVIATYAAPGR